MSASETVILDATAVERFLSTVTGLRQLVHRLDRARPGATGLADTFARDAEARATVARFLAERGYASLEAWDAAVRAVAIAYGFADPQSGLAALPDTLRSALAEVRADRTLSEDEKQASIGELEAEIAAAEALVPPPENVAAVRPFMARLKTVLSVD